VNVRVSHAGGDEYAVEIVGRTRHTVSAPAKSLQRLLREGETPEHGIERVIAYLLDREPPESILRRFTLDDVPRYFPTFWSDMGG
jgi:hypothetical protein